MVLVITERLIYHKNTALGRCWWSDRGSTASYRDSPVHSGVTEVRHFPRTDSGGGRVGLALFGSSGRSLDLFLARESGEGERKARQASKWEAEDRKKIKKATWQQTVIWTAKPQWP